MSHAVESQRRRFPRLEVPLLHCLPPVRWFKSGGRRKRQLSESGKRHDNISFWQHFDRGNVIAPWSRRWEKGSEVRTYRAAYLINPLAQLMLDSTFPWWSRLCLHRRCKHFTRLARVCAYGHWSKWRRKESGEAPGRGRARHRAFADAFPLRFFAKTEKKTIILKFRPSPIVICRCLTSFWNQNNVDQYINIIINNSNNVSPIAHHHKMSNCFALFVTGPGDWVPWRVRKVTVRWSIC